MSGSRPASGASCEPTDEFVTDSKERAYAVLADELRAAGYLVFKVPDCTIERPHGRHTLITRSGHCDGVGPIPHGLRNIHMGSFGYWASCQCGHSFSDVTWPDDPPDRVTPWGAHKAEHGLGD